MAGTIFSPTGNGSLVEIPVSARRTESLDAPEIMKLVDEETGQLFGRVNVVHMIEKANLAVTLVDEENYLIGHAAFYEQPNWSIKVDDDLIHGMAWLKRYYSAAECNPVNTLFLHYFVSKGEFSVGVLTEIVRTVFNALPFLHYIVLVTPKDVDTGVALGKLFEKLPQVNEDVDLKYVAHVCHRHNHCPVLHIRNARVEDHDDLMPIFNKHNTHLTELYGDFFLAELIEAQNDDNKCIVADVNGTAVGFMSLSTSVNHDLLKSGFQLEVFSHLKSKVPKPPEAEPQAPEKQETSSESLSPPKRTASSKSGTSLRSSKSRSGKLSSRHMRDSVSPVEDDPQSPTEKTEKVEKAPAKQEFIEVDGALCIQLFCIDEKYETRSIDFLPKVFELFPDKEFIIITIPHTVPEFPLLQIFQRASPKPSSTLSQELYVFSRNGLLSSFNVRHCLRKDVDAIKTLSQNIKNSKQLIKDVRKYIDYRKDEDGCFIHAFVAEVQEQVVGICVLRQEQNIDYLRARYNIEDFIYFSHHELKEHGRLYHFALNPVFQHYSKYFLKEVLYLSRKSCLYYPIYPSFFNGQDSYSLITCLNDLVPVSARHQIKYPLEELGINAPVDSIISEQENFALYHVNRKLTMEPKVVINVRIVVVGASDVGIACLQTLAFCPHLSFNNLTLISDGDLPGNRSEDEETSPFLPTSLCYSYKDHINMSLRSWVNVVKGKLTAIDRSNKVLTINGKKHVPYDHLILCTGVQFQTTVPTGVDISQLLTTSEALQARLPSVHRGYKPDQVFTINNAEDCSAVFDWVKSEFISHTGTALIYGSTIEAYSFVFGLMSHGVEGSRITMVQPPCGPPTCFNNPHIDKEIKKILENEGVTIHQGYTLAQWNNGKEGSSLYEASFTSDSKPIALDCQAFFCFDKKTVDYHAFKAINDACLVFDGKLVIDVKFNTNDPSIRAAGPLTKYARRYHSDSWSHANFNSKEIGNKLAESLLQLFDPTLEECGGVKEDSLLIPTYGKPTQIYAQLPGGYHYFHLSKPSVKATLESMMAQPDYGEQLVTGLGLKDDVNDYFMLHINQYNTVQTITCLSTKPIKASNYACLYGVHERYLNNLRQRFNEGLIKDFYRYLEESWCLALYHDRFQDFRSEVRELLSSAQAGEDTSLEQRVRKLIEEDLVLSSDHRSVIEDNFVGSGGKKLIERRMLSFLNYNQYHLPMYARPGML